MGSGETRRARSVWETVRPTSVRTPRAGCSSMAPSAEATGASWSHANPMLAKTAPRATARMVAANRKHLAITSRRPFRWKNLLSGLVSRACALLSALRLAATGVAVSSHAFPSKTSAASNTLCVVDHSAVVFMSFTLDSFTRELAFDALHVCTPPLVNTRREEFLALRTIVAEALRTITARLDYFALPTAQVRLRVAV